MQTGNFTICANHSGNIEDVPYRVINLIKESDYIFCDHIDVFNRDIVEPNGINLTHKTVIETGNYPNKIQDEVYLGNLAVELLKNQKSIVFICDTGLPGIADQGTKMIDIIYENGFNVDIINGPSIPAAALAIAGIPSSNNEYHFISLFDYSDKDVSASLSKIKDLPCPTVILDYFHNIPNLIQLVSSVLGEQRFASICINIGMPGQQIIRGTLKDLIAKNISLDESYVSIVVDGLSDNAIFSKIIKQS